MSLHCQVRGCSVDASLHSIVEDSHSFYHTELFGVSVRLAALGTTARTPTFTLSLLTLTDSSSLSVISLVRFRLSLSTNWSIPSVAEAVSAARDVVSEFTTGYSPASAVASDCSLVGCWVVVLAVGGPSPCCCCFFHGQLVTTCPLWLQYLGKKDWGTKPAYASKSGNKTQHRGLPLVMMRMGTFPQRVLRVTLPGTWLVATLVSVAVYCELRIAYSPTLDLANWLRHLIHNIWEHAGWHPQNVNQDILQQERLQLGRPGWYIGSLNSDADNK